MRGVDGSIKVLLYVMAAAGLLLGWFAHYQTRFPGDLEVSLLLQSFQSQPFLNAMEIISYVIGSWRGMIVFAAAAMIVWRSTGPLEGFTVLLSGLFTGANELFKILVNRPRPSSELVHIYVNEIGKSFPSGHSFFAVAVLGFLCYIIATNQEGRLSKALTICVWLIFTLAVGASRIYLGAHWISDVIGGYLVGGAFLVLEVWLYQKLKQHSKARQMEKAQIELS